MSAVLPVYARTELLFDRGEGTYLFTPEGKKYLDFAAGIAVNCLGHSHPKLVAALQDQAAKLWHVSNFYQIPLLEEYAAALTAATHTDYAFFCNSGAEAMECAIKMVRKYQRSKGHTNKYRMITFKGCFHGRTMATISASGAEKLLGGFEPALEGFDILPFNDIEAVKAAITPQTGGILIEPIQGEGGINPACHCFIQQLRELANQHDIVLVFDEVQCGMGRTGKLFAAEWYGIEPDVIATAKGIGGGFPMGGVVAKKHVALALTPGSHGSTYANNPLAVRVGYTILNIINTPEFLSQVRTISASLVHRLQALQQQFPTVIETVRGMGLMIGIKLFPSNLEFAKTLREKGLLSVPAGDNVIRLLPPLNISEKEVDEAMSLLTQVATQYAAAKQ